MRLRDQTHESDAAQLDRISWRILEELQENARVSWAELGRRVGLTTPAVAERVHRLESIGIIQGYRTAISVDRLGLPILIFVRLSMSGPEALVRTFQQQVKTWDEVLECHRVTGSESFILKARVVSMGHLERFIDQLGHYGSTSTTTVLSSPVERRGFTEKMIRQFENGK